MPSTELTLPGDERILELPEPRHEAAKAVFGRLARVIDWLPSDLEPRRFLIAAATETNRLSLDVTPSSAVRTVFNCAVVGLLPGDVLGHAHFVTFKIHRGKPDERTECQLVIGYRGFLELGYASGFLKDAICEVVLTGEEYQRWNDENGSHFKHDLSNPDRDETFEAIKLAYCQWSNRFGGNGVVVVPKGELRKLKKRRNVWDTNPVAMSKKTPIRRASNLWQQTRRLAAARELDEQAERDEPQLALVPEDAEPEVRPDLDTLPSEPEKDSDE